MSGVRASAPQGHLRPYLGVRALGRARLHPMTEGTRVRKA